MYGRYEIDEILDSEAKWEHNFDVQFVQENEDGSEWWRVIHIESKRTVSCNSMVQAFRICILAQERLDFGHIQSYGDTNAIRKSCYLLYGDKYITSAYYKMNGYKYFNNRWVEVKRN